MHQRAGNGVSQLVRLLHQLLELPLLLQRIYFRGGGSSLG